MAMTHFHNQQHSPTLSLLCQLTYPAHMISLLPQCFGYKEPNSYSAAAKIVCCAVQASLSLVKRHFLTTLAGLPIRFVCQCSRASPYTFGGVIDRSMEG